MKKYAVIGNPVEHSQSPVLHQGFAASLGLKISYIKLFAEINRFAEVLSHFFENGGAGVNVTAPFKEEAFSFVDVLTDRAKKVGAVNTIWKKDGKYYGDTTDGAGLVRALTEHNQTAKDKTMLLIGAGGAVKSVLPDLIAEKPKKIVLVNRTVEKAVLLAKEYEAACDIEVGGLLGTWDEQKFDLVINGTSASLQGELPGVSSHCIRPTTFCYDMVYGEEETLFNQWCLDQGAINVADGKGMLRQQAAEAFFIWHGVRPSLGRHPRV
jgi:shikimate dehydrogenase